MFVRPIFFELQVGMQLELRQPSVWQFVAGNGSDARLSNAWGQPRAYAIVPTGAPFGCFSGLTQGWISL